MALASSTETPTNLVEVNDVSADVVQEGLVVGNDEERLLPVLQVVVQPDDSVQVEVVGRFVQHEEGRLDEEGARERDSHSPAAGKLVGGPVLHLAAEAEASEKTSSFRFGLKLNRCLRRKGQKLNFNRLPRHVNLLRMFLKCPLNLSLSNY